MNTRLTNILLIILLIFNIAFLCTWWKGHRRFHHPEPASIKPETSAILNDRDKGEMFLIKTLGFDSLQKREVDKILQVHFDFLDKYMSAYVRNQSNLFKALKDNKDSSYAFRCVDSLGILKVIMTRELYSHFVSIRNICNNVQQKQFDTLIDGISKEFNRHHDFHNSGEKKNHDSL